MPRLRGFYPQTALTDAMRIFWQNGYAEISMEAIVTDTGDSRYSTFGNNNYRETPLMVFR